MTATDLLPCPFCGGDQMIEVPVLNTQGNRRYISCRICSAQGPWSYKPLTATNQWNRRSQPEPTMSAEEVNRLWCEAIINTQDGKSGRMICDVEQLLAYVNGRKVRSLDLSRKEKSGV